LRSAHDYPDDSVRFSRVDTMPFSAGRTTHREGITGDGDRQLAASADTKSNNSEATRACTARPSRAATFFRAKTSIRGKGTISSVNHNFGIATATFSPSRFFHGRLRPDLESEGHDLRPCHGDSPPSPLSPFRRRSHVGVQSTLGHNTSSTSHTIRAAPGTTYAHSHYSDRACP